MDVDATERMKDGLERQTDAWNRRRHVEREDQFELPFTSNALDVAVALDPVPGGEMFNRPRGFDLELGRAQDDAAGLILRRQGRRHREENSSHPYRTLPAPSKHATPPLRECSIIEDSYR